MHFTLISPKPEYASVARHFSYKNPFSICSFTDFRWQNITVMLFYVIVYTALKIALRFVPHTALRVPVRNVTDSPTFLVYTEIALWTVA